VVPHEKKRYTKRWGSLKRERSSYDGHWNDLAEHIMPRKIRLQTSSGQNTGSKKNQKINNNTATRSLRILASGMMAGITSPARPWFRLSTPDPDLNERQDVLQWVGTVRDRMLEIFARSNLYNVLAKVYFGLGGFGTAAMLVEEDDDDVIRARIFPLGSYCLATDHKQRVTTLYRETTLTVEQIFQRFDPENISTRVKTLQRNGELDTACDVMHVIEPNDKRVPSLADKDGMAFRSVWYETGGDEHGPLLGYGGFEEQPMMCPRWNTDGDEAYGDCPGMDALPDTRQLQLFERRKAQAFDKIVNPPMTAPAAMKSQRNSILPGDVTYVVAGAMNQKFEPAHIVDSRALQIGEELSRIERRIASTFFADLFLLLANSSVPSMTAREIEERHEEKMLQLGPVLEGLHDELLEPLIDRTFAIMLRRGLIPQPPEVLQGQDLRVEEISILAQAQKLVGTVAVERLAQFALSLSAQVPDITDKIDWDEMVDTYADLLGTPPELVVADDEVRRKREQRTQQIQAQQAEQVAATAKDATVAASNLDSLENPEAIQRMLQTLGGTQAVA
jgi:hypothetical protein